MKIEVEFFTNRGLIRDKNEDSILIDREIFSSEDFDTIEKREINHNSFFIVADGLGGHKKGEIASKIVVESFLKQQVNSIESIQEIIYEAKKLLDKEVLKSSSLFGLGSTVAGVFIKEDKFFVFNLGDSRVYRYSRPFLEQLTNDHSFVQKLLEDGIISLKEVRSHPQKNLLTSAIIGDNSKQIPQIYIKELKSKSEIFCICSDGVWEAMEIEEFEECFESQNVSEEIINRVIKFGAKDNFSFILVKVEK